LSDVPTIGSALSGTNAKVRDVKIPSVEISSLKDEIGAVREAAEEGNLDFGVQGILSTSLDIELEPNRPGVAPVTIKSPLIPKWHFKRQKSDCFKVSNCGNGKCYYFNSSTGGTRYDEPESLQ
jgi:hypothetical protein